MVIKSNEYSKNSKYFGTIRVCKKVVVLFSGTGSNFAHIVKTLHQKECEVVFALTNNPNAGGIKIAQDNQIPYGVVESKSFDSREEFDAVVVVETLE